MKEPKKLKLKELVNEIVSKECRRPMLNAAVEVYGDKKPEYEMRVDNFKQRLSALYEEIDRRDKLYDS